MEKRNAAIGMVLFVVYLVLYGGFVFLTAFSADTMEMTPLPGINLAILYGFGLIIAAFVLAMLYGYLCRERNGSTGVGGKGANDNGASGTEGER